MWERYLPPLLAFVNPYYHSAWQMARERRKISAMARPLREAAPLVHDLKFLVDEKTFRELTLYCEMTGKEKSQVIRKSLKIFLARQFSIV